MKPYPAYKDSGIAWLGDVPQKWDIKRLRFVSQINPSRVGAVPLCDLEARPKHDKNFWPVREYVVWFANR